MTRNELRERVARAIWEAQCEHWQPYRAMLEDEGRLCPYDELGNSRRKELASEADAAIAIVLGEAARVALKDKDTYPTDRLDDGWNAACDNIAAAIRAMKGESNDTR